MSEIPLDIPIRSTNDPSGTNAAAAGLKNVKDQGESAKTALNDLGYSAENLKRQLVEFVALAAIFQQFKEGWEEAKNLAREYRALDIAAQRLGDSTPAMRAELHKVVQELRETAAVSDHESIPALVKLYREYGNMGDAAKAANLAVAIVAAGMAKDFAGAIDIVHLAAVGNVKALKELGIVIEGVEGAGNKGAAALKALAEQARTAYVDQSSLAFQTKQLKNEWEDARVQAVEGIKTALPYILALFKTAYEGMNAAWSILTNSIVSGGVLIKDVLDVVKVRTVEGMKTWAETLKKDAADIPTFAAERTKLAAANMAKAWEDMAHRIKQLNVDELPPPLAGPKVDKVAHFSTDLRLELLKVEGKAATAFVEKQRAEYAVLRREEENALKELAKTDGNTETNRDLIRKIYYQKRQELRNKETAEARKAFEAETKALEDEIKKQITYEEKLDKWREGLREKKRKADQADVDQAIADAEKVAKQKVKLEELAANAAVSILGDVFGNTKEVAIIQALINTAVGATKAYDQLGIFGYAGAALVIAAGMAQVAAISSQNYSGKSVSGGFDDPANDRMAYLTGHRWAEDMVQQISAGWGSGLKGSTTNITNDYSQRTTVQASGLLVNSADRNSLMNLQRGLDMVNLTVGRRRQLNP
jgi:hypothetical protein